MKDCSLEEAGDEGAERLQTRLLAKRHAGRCEAAGRGPYQHVRCFAVGRNCLCRAGLYSTHEPILEWI